MRIMTVRASLSITEPNESWIQAQIDSKEFSSRSEVINDLIRKAREIERIRAKLIAAEEGGFSNRTADEILAVSKAALRADGKI